MWFVLSLIAMLCWSGSDLFSKIACQGERDKYSHLKMVTAVGIVMGLHAAYEVFFNGIEFNLEVVFQYMPVSILYIASMTLGYLGLRYIELAISSPICNSSGALVAILCFAFGFTDELKTIQIVAIAVVCLSVIALGVVEVIEDEESRQIRQAQASRQYKKTFMALALPIAYAILDALGTFGDGIVLQKLDEDSANAAYEFTFLIFGIVAFIYVKFVKHESYLPREEGPKFLGAICETAGQFAYIYAISDTEHLALSAPMIASYCLISVIWGHVFLKEKLSPGRYVIIFIALIGIGILGFYDA
ncbi:MAG: EamA family transporter [Clostridia bacterium]|nr:EamA family transporter [Clostridia bacterium]